MRRRLSDLVLVLIILAGLAVFFYPWFSDYWNSFHQSRAIAGYAEALAVIDEEQYDEILEEAREYNRMLSDRPFSLELSEEEVEEYEKKLRISDDGMMAYIDIPKLNTSLPIYHGTDESVLQIAIGHLAGTSLPVGGPGTHTALSGHRGLPSAKLFSDLDKLVEGDIFTIQVLGETLIYQVDQVMTVLPYELDSLHIEPGRDYCTLITCTPYGINTHRLLVRGRRTDVMYEIEEKRDYRISADAGWVEEVTVGMVTATPLLLMLLILLAARTMRRNKENKRRKMAGLMPVWYEEPKI